MKEKQTIHRICPCHHYDIEGIQTWLEDMANDGWLLEKGGYGLGTFTFNRSQPTKCRYRMEVIFEGKKSYQDRLDYLEMLKEFGWTHITEYKGFEIFRTTNMDATEISTDPIIQASTLKKLKSASINRIIFLVFYGFFLTINKRLGWVYLFRNAAVFGPMATGLLIFYLLLALILPIYDLWKIHRLEKKLRGGQLLNQPAQWRPRARLHRSFSILPAALGILVAAILIGGIFNALNQIPLSSAVIDPPFVTIEDLSDSDYELTDPPLSGNNHYVYWSNPITPVNYEWREYAKFIADGTGNTGFLVVDYHETVSEWFAKGLADDYYTYEFNRFTGTADLETPDFGLDDVRVFGRHGSYEMVIRHGNIVLHATYSQWNGGETPDWQVWLEAMAEMLLK